MKKQQQKAQRQNRRADQIKIGRSISEDVVNTLLSSHTQRPPSRTDEACSALFEQSIRDMRKRGLPQDEVQKIDQRHGQIVVMVEDQAFIAGLCAGLKLAAVVK